MHVLLRCFFLTSASDVRTYARWMIKEKSMHARKAINNRALVQRSFPFENTLRRVQWRNNLTSFDNSLDSIEGDDEREGAGSIGRVLRREKSERRSSKSGHVNCNRSFHVTGEHGDTKYVSPLIRSYPPFMPFLCAVCRMKLSKRETYWPCRRRDEGRSCS